MKKMGLVTSNKVALKLKHWTQLNKKKKSIKKTFEALVVIPYLIWCLG